MLGTASSKLGTIRVILSWCDLYIHFWVNLDTHGNTQTPNTPTHIHTHMHTHTHKDGESAIGYGTWSRVCGGLWPAAVGASKQLCPMGAVHGLLPAYCWGWPGKRCCRESTQNYLIQVSNLLLPHCGACTLSSNLQAIHPLTSLFACLCTCEFLELTKVIEWTRLKCGVIIAWTYPSFLPPSALFVPTLLLFPHTTLKQYHSHTTLKVKHSHTTLKVHDSHSTLQVHHSHANLKEYHDQTTTKIIHT